MAGPWGHLRTLGGLSMLQLFEDTHLALLFVLRVGVRIMNGLEGSACMSRRSIFWRPHPFFNGVFFPLPLSILLILDLRI